MSAPPSPIDRRRFLEVGTAGAAGLALVPGTVPGLLERWGRPTAAPVALVRTDDRREGVRRALALLDPLDVRGRDVVLKPNFNSADGGPASTHPETLGAVVHALRERGANRMTLGESSGPSGTRKVMEEKGVRELGRELDFGVVNYDEIPESEWVPFPSAGTHWPEGFHLPRLIVDAEYPVSVCCLKTHGYGGVFTMSLKLSVGLTPRPIRRTMHRSPHMRRMIAELNAGYRPRLVVMDGVEAFVDGGPSSGELRRTRVVVAGRDRVAVDAVGLAVLKEVGSNEAIMGRPIFAQEQMARAVELGLGVEGAGEIRLVTADDDEESRSYARRLREILDAG